MKKSKIILALASCFILANGSCSKGKDLKYNLVSYTSGFNNEVIKASNTYEYYFVKFYNNKKYELSFKMKDDSKQSTTFGKYEKKDNKYYVVANDTDLVYTITNGGKNLECSIFVVDFYFELEN